VAQRRAYELDAHDRRDVRLVDEEGQAVDDESVAAVQELRRLPTRLQRLVLMRTQVETQRGLAQLLNLSPGRVSVLLAKAARLVEFAATAKQVSLPALPARSSTAGTRDGATGLADQRHRPPRRPDLSRRAGHRLA
jgi:hypothetical protein